MLSGCSAIPLNWSMTRRCLPLLSKLMICITGSPAHICRLAALLSLRPCPTLGLYLHFHSSQIPLGPHEDPLEGPRGGLGSWDTYLVILHNFC